MKSHCLMHQDKVATARCAVCSKPLCENCVQTYAEGIFCSDQCHENAKQSAVRGAELAKSEREHAEWRQRQTAIKLITYVVVGFALFFGWDYLPLVITDNVERAWAAFKGFLKAAFP